MSLDYTPPPEQVITQFIELVHNHLGQDLLPEHLPDFSAFIKLVVAITVKTFNKKS